MDIQLANLFSYFHVHLLSLIGLTCACNSNFQSFDPRLYEICDYEVLCLDDRTKNYICICICVYSYVAYLKKNPAVLQFYLDLIIQ